jgi:hypothetical protein
LCGTHAGWAYQGDLKGEVPDTALEPMKKLAGVRPT